MRVFGTGEAGTKGALGDGMQTLTHRDSVKVTIIGASGGTDIFLLRWDGLYHANEFAPRILIEDRDRRYESWDFVRNLVNAALEDGRVDVLVEFAINGEASYFLWTSDKATQEKLEWLFGWL